MRTPPDEVPLAGDSASNGSQPQSRTRYITQESREIMDAPLNDDNEYRVSVLVKKHGVIMTCLRRYPDTVQENPTAGRTNQEQIVHGPLLLEPNPFPQPTMAQVVPRDLIPNLPRPWKVVSKSPWGSPVAQQHALEIRDIVTGSAPSAAQSTELCYRSDDEKIAAAALAGLGNARVHPSVLANTEMIDPRLTAVDAHHALTAGADADTDVVAATPEDREDTEIIDPRLIADDANTVTTAGADIDIDDLKTSL